MRRRTLIKIFEGTPKEAVKFKMEWPASEVKLIGIVVKYADGTRISFYI